MRSSTETLISALRILARDIQSEDGIANAAIWEAADRLAELDAENAALRADKERLDSGMIRLRSDNGWGMVWCIYKGMDLRAAIDAARKEEQP